MKYRIKKEFCVQTNYTEYTPQKRYKYWPFWFNIRTIAGWVLRYDNEEKAKDCIESEKRLLKYKKEQEAYFKSLKIETAYYEV